MISDREVKSLINYLRSMADEIEQVGIHDLNISVNMPVRESGVEADKDGILWKKFEYTGEFNMFLKFTWNGSKK